MVKKLGAVILAAGLARRMGRQKLLLPLNGKPLLAHVLEVAGGFDWADCIAVIGQPPQALAQLCEQYHVKWTVNPFPWQGQASSIRLALQQLAPDLAGVLFFMGDQPFISEPFIQAIVEKFSLSKNMKAIVVPQYQGQNGSPVLFGAAWRKSLGVLQGDEGGRTILRANTGQVVYLDWPEGRVFADADTWTAYQTMLGGR